MAGPAGRAGEELAAALLAREGFRIVARNLRVAGAEIDLLVRRRRLWVAVEVKTRRWHPAPEALVEPAQHDRLAAALQALADHLRPAPLALRVDVVAVRLPGASVPELRHFPGTELPWRPKRTRGFWRRRLWTI